MFISLNLQRHALLGNDQRGGCIYFGTSCFKETCGLISFRANMVENDEQMHHNPQEHG